MPTNEPAKNIFLIEDHDQALGVWRKKKASNLDLVHIDAHMDFGFYWAKPIQRIFREAKTLKGLKRDLEYSLAFRHYEKDFSKQTHIGNYIYPAMQEGIVKDFYWVVPGGLKEFKGSTKFIRTLLKDILRGDSFGLNRGLRAIPQTIAKGIISTRLLGRNFTICTLEKLPILKQKILLDIDTDFLVIDSVLNAGNTRKIGKRKPWILPLDLVNILKRKIKHPHLITIAYSVNGGYTPIIYKNLGDQIAYYFAPKKFNREFKNNSEAAYYFNLFSSTRKKEYYHKAAKLNPAYRVTDNNYGPLFLSLKKISLAEKEFKKILCADPENPAALLGLGSVALERKDFNRAEKYFFSIRRLENHKLFTRVKNQSLFGLARAEFGLKNFTMAKELFIRYLSTEPLHAQSYYFLGNILEKEKDFGKAAIFYKDAIRLGLCSIRQMSQLLKICYHLKEKDDIILYVLRKYKEFKKIFHRTKSLRLKRGEKITRIRKIENKMAIFEKRLKSYFALYPATKSNHNS